MSLELIDGKIVDTSLPRPRARFYEHAKKVGKGQYVPVDYIEIRPIGSKDHMSRPATEEDKKLYPNEWQDYKSGLAGEEEGLTPLSSLSRYKAAFGLELANMGVHTVEELAARPEVDEYLIPLWKEAKARVMAIEMLEAEDGAIKSA